MERGVGATNASIARDLLPGHRIHQTLKGVVGRFEAIAPGCFLAYYLLGSHADGTAVPASDLDLLVLACSSAVLRADRSEELRTQCSTDRSLRVSLQIQTIETVRQHPRSLAMLRQGSVLLHGEDCRPALPDVDVNGYARQVLALAESFVLLGRAGDALTSPLHHLDEHDEFYGRTRVAVPSLYWPPAHEGTKELAKETLWLATALLATNCGVVVGSARQALEAYLQVGGEWAGFVQDAAECCKHQWNYEVPRRASDRQHLRTICQGLLDFENYCVAILRIGDRL